MRSRRGRKEGRVGWRVDKSLRMGRYIDMKQRKKERWHENTTQQSIMDLLMTDPIAKKGFTWTKEELCSFK